MRVVIRSKFLGGIYVEDSLKRSSHVLLRRVFHHGGMGFTKYDSLSNIPHCVAKTTA